MKGAAFGLSHNFQQVGYLRPQNRHRLYKNLYFTGASTHPGTGLPIVLLSAKLTVERIAKELGQYNERHSRRYARSPHGGVSLKSEPGEHCMPSINQSPAYNLKAVLKETGLKADVLRAWERRYDLPKPHRSLGGHRLYSEYDIETVKWLRSRQAEGLSISRAVELWKEMIQAGRDPLAEYTPAGATPAMNQWAVAGSRIEILRQNWLEAGLAFDSMKADEILNQAFAIYPVETVCTEILQRGVSEIGNYWYLDKASAQQEHFVTALASRRLEALITATPRPTRAETVLVGCPPGERHTFSVLLLSLLLRRKGMEVVYLGADIPIERMEETAGGH